jgi:hypothetical protein
VRLRMPRIEVARLFEPRDRLVCARLQQMEDADPEIPDTQQVVAGAEADRLLVKRDRVLDQPGLKLTLGERFYWKHLTIGI